MSEWGKEKMESTLETKEIWSELTWWKENMQENECTHSLETFVGSVSKNQDVATGSEGQTKRDIHTRNKGRTEFLV